MAVVILGASGGTGRHLVRIAGERGLDVRALARTPGAGFVLADVHDPASIAAAVAPDDVLVSALGLRRRADAGTLIAGARAAVAARPRRIVWLGATGTGPSAAKVSGFTRRLLRAGFGAEHTDKETADAVILNAGGTVVHSGVMSDRVDRPGITLVPLAALPHRFWPAGAPRATIARLMLDEAVAAAPRTGVLAVRASG
ncbi:NAD(P)H-binding protein [Actinoplanes sp. NBRC 103695]|uniref:NAD(P)H-binding protein n=1 Tax=Actinoplanes sp. NBRC 103695 TaxID=3032202 RepID=UPI0024A5D756|nr:NAD(P)H-binding protein [Actinoplanes sp. NBRC 103695]GLZ00070.1 flavin reductase [Actinoplanes sp. NBRC 103695]